MCQEIEMGDNPIIGIYLRAHGYNPKYIIKRKTGPSQDRYDVYRPWDKIDIVRDLIQLLEKEIKDFLPKYSAVDEKYYKSSSHRVRRYISKERKELYPTQDEKFMKTYSYSIKGYWVGTNIGAREITQYVREMCEACEIEFGTISEIKL
jgi:hypothetical protein